MLKFQLKKNMSHYIYQVIREIVIVSANSIVIALSLYGIFWLVLLLPDHFDSTLLQLMPKKTGTPEYHHFFNTLYASCLFIGFMITVMSRVCRIWRNKLSTNTHIEVMLASKKIALKDIQCVAVHELGQLAPKKMTLKDIQCVAIHEAGHLLVYAALGQLPPSIEVKIEENINGTTGLGYVSGVASKRVSASRLFIEWKMLTMLAGKEGESFILHDNTLGSILDNHQWVQLATSYLKNHFEGIFYLEPQSEFEFKSNEEKLNRLKEKQIKLLQEFFKLNSRAYIELASTLTVKKVLHSHDIIQFFLQANIKFPQNFPLPFGYFQKFSSEWRQNDDYGDD